MKPTVTVCVTCVGGVLTYDTVSALRDANDFDVYVLGVDADPSAPGRLLCDRFEVVPMADADEEAYLRRLLDLHSEIGIDVYLALSEAESRFAARHSSVLQESAMRLSVSSYETVREMTDKLLMLGRLESYGVDCGSYLEVNSRDEGRHAIEVLDYPNQKVVLKPRDGRGSRGIMIVSAAEDGFRQLLPNRFCGIGPFEALADAMDAEGMTFENLVAVPFYDGEFFDIDCISVQGEMIDAVARMRQFRPPLWPASKGHRVTMEPRILEYARQLCAAFRVDGAGDFDIVLANGDRPLLIDAGARFSGSVGISFRAGANFPAQLVRVLMGFPYTKLEVEDGVVVRPFVTMARIPEHNQDDLL